MVEYGSAKIHLSTMDNKLKIVYDRCVLFNIQKRGLKAKKKAEKTLRNKINILLFFSMSSSTLQRCFLLAIRISRETTIFH